MGTDGPPAHALAAKLLSRYIRRKRLFLPLRAATEGLAWAKLSGALPREACTADFLGHTPLLRVGLSPSYKMGLRRRIHARIEEMKRARE